MVSMLVSGLLQPSASGLSKRFVYSDKIHLITIYSITSTLSDVNVRNSSFVQIVNSYKTNTKLEQMLQNLDVYVTPVINVDGYNYTWVNSSVSASQVLF